MNITLFYLKHLAKFLKRYFSRRPPALGLGSVCGPDRFFLPTSGKNEYTKNPLGPTMPIEQD